MYKLSEPDRELSEGGIIPVRSFQEESVNGPGLLTAVMSDIVGPLNTFADAHYSGFYRPRQASQRRFVSNI